MFNNAVKARLQRGEVALGAECATGLPLLAEVLARQGFDWVHVDGQHTAWHRHTFTQAFAAVRSGGATPIARVNQNDYYAIGHVLDDGAHGVIIPMVHTAEEAEQAQFAARFPPLGGRSGGYGGAVVYGPDYIERANDEVLLAVQIESADGLENADAIMAVESVDACWVGPTDLGRSIGHEPGSPRHVEAVMHIFEVCRKHGKAPGIAGGGLASARRWIDTGALFVTVSSDLDYVLSGSSAEARAFGRTPLFPDA